MNPSPISRLLRFMTSPFFIHRPRHPPSEICHACFVSLPLGRGSFSGEEKVPHLSRGGGVLWYFLLNFRLLGSTNHHTVSHTSHVTMLLGESLREGARGNSPSFIANIHLIFPPSSDTLLPLALPPLSLDRITDSQSVRRARCPLATLPSSSHRLCPKIRTCPPLARAASRTISPSAII
jgi:hypothetical protein